VPGLLQTEQYARNILSGYNQVVPISPLAIQRRLETRLIRQQLLTRDEPLQLVSLLDEAVLLRQHGGEGSAVMRAQLQRLADTVRLQSNVTIQVLPLNKSRLAVDSFGILEFGNAEAATLHDVVSIENLNSELYVEGDTDTHQFRLAFDHLAGECLSPSDSRELILATARQAWGAA
jgi:hypothetical protein